MPPNGVPSGQYRGVNAAHRAQLRAAIRLVSRQVQALGTRVRELEATCDRIRDRATLPTPEGVRSQIAPKWQIVWNALKAAEKSIADYFAMFV